MNYDETFLPETDLFVPEPDRYTLRCMQGVLKDIDARRLGPIEISWGEMGETSRAIQRVSEHMRAYVEIALLHRMPDVLEVQAGSPELGPDCSLVPGYIYQQEIFATHARYRIALEVMLEDWNWKPGYAPVKLLKMTIRSLEQAFPHLFASELDQSIAL